MMGWILTLRKPSPPLSIIGNAKFRILPPQPRSRPQGRSGGDVEDCRAQQSENKKFIHAMQQAGYVVTAPSTAPGTKAPRPDTNGPIACSQTSVSAGLLGMMNSSKDALKNAKGFKYDRNAMTWIPEDQAQYHGGPFRVKERRIGAHIVKELTQHDVSKRGFRASDNLTGFAANWSCYGHDAVLNGVGAA